MSDGSLATPQRDNDPAPSQAPPTKAQGGTKDAPPPTPQVAPQLAHDDPSLAHPANTPLRAAAMSQLQRGVGNRAVQAAVAALDGRTPARRDSQPRPREAKEDILPPELEEDEAAPDQKPPDLPPLTAEPLRNEYDSPQTIGADLLSFASPSRSPAREAEARTIAEQSYASLRGRGQSLHTASLNEANRALDAVTAAHAEAATRLDAFEARCGQQIDAMEQLATGSVDQTSDATLLLLKTAHDAAVKALTTVVRQANGHIGGLKAHAEKERDKVVGDAKAAYTTEFKKAKDECQGQEQAAEKALTDWLTKLKTSTPTGDAVDRACAEALQAAAPTMVENEIKGLVEMRDSVKNNYTEMDNKLTPKVGEMLSNQINGNIKNGIDKGYETVDTARKQALAGLEQQLHDGIHAVEQMRRGGRASVRSASGGAHARVAGIVRARKADLRADANRTLEGVTTGVQPALRLYAASPDRLAAALSRAARRGPEPLNLTARNSPPGIRAAMENAQRLHADRVAINAASMQGMLTRDEQKCAAEGEEELARSRQQIDQTSGGVTQQMEESGAAQQAAFTSITESVNATAETWAKSYAAGLAVSMAAYRKGAAKGFDTFMKGDELKDAKPARATSGVPKGANAPPATGSVPKGDKAPPATGIVPKAVEVPTAAASVPKGDKALPDSGDKKADAFNTTKETIKDKFEKRLNPAQYFEKNLNAINAGEKEKLKFVTSNAIAAAADGNGRKLMEQLRSITAAEGPAIIQVSVGLGNHTSLDEIMLRQVALRNLDGDDYHAAMAYLNGKRVEGARYEIKASLGFWSDDTTRIEAAMRNLTEKELGEFREKGKEEIEQARGWWHLGGTNLQVFDALVKGEPARATAIRAIQKVDEAKRTGKYDDLNESLKTAFGATTAFGKVVDTDDKRKADEHRKNIQFEMAKILRGRKTAGAGADVSPAGPALDDQTVVINFVTEKVEVPVGGDFDSTITFQIEGANRKLAEAIIAHGADSREAKIAQVGVEYQRPDGPTVLKLDQVLVDKRLNPKALLDKDGKEKVGPELEIAKKAQTEFQKEHTALIRDAAIAYLGAPTKITDADAIKLAKEKFGQRIGPDSEGGAEYVGALIDAGYPTPEIAARGMSYAMYSSFWHTDKDLMRQIVSRMDADEIKDMRASFQGFTGKDLYNELGVYHHGGWFTTLSGDSRLEFERLLLGQPRNDFERAQLALFTIEQQRRETGRVGKFLAGGSDAEAAMEQTRSELIGSLGGTAEVDSEGRLTVPAGVFGKTKQDKNQYLGDHREQFESSIALSKAVAENYAAHIDSIASTVTTIIAVIGTVVAAVATVLTAGAASPLLLGAIALTAGLAGMGAHRLISGGRYGWHEAARDFGMTLVQALTAGVGAQLGILSRGGMAAIEAAQAAEEAAAAGVATAEQLAAREGAQMGQILGSKGADVALIGVTTGAISGAGQALFNEKSWEKGGFGAIEAMLEGTIRGALAGLATSIASQAVEGIRIPGAKGGPLGEVMGGLGGAGRGNLAWDSVKRGVLKSLSSSFGAMAGKSVEVGWDKAAGKFHGSAAEEIVHAGAFAALQGGLEGMAEAPAERLRTTRQAARIQNLREQGLAANAAEPAKPATPPLSLGPESEPPRVLPIEAPQKPRVQPVALPPEPAAEPASARMRAPRAPTEEPPARPAVPRSPGEPPAAEAPESTLRYREGFALLPEETVIRAPNPTSSDEAHEIYGNVIADQSDREAAIYRNPETGEFVVIQGEAMTVGVRGAPGADLETPAPGGTAQRWKEILEGPDTGRWELVAHFHPADQPGGGISLPGRMPSGGTGDFGALESEALQAGAPRQSRIHYLEKGAWGYTDFGFDPAPVKGRYWVDHADAVGGGRTRVEFESIDQYREWFQSNFGRSPEVTSAPPHTPAMPSEPETQPPAAVLSTIDTMLKAGVPIEHPSPEVVAKARLAFEEGTATPSDLDVLMKKAVADARTVLATRDMPHPSLSNDNWDKFVYDLAALSWYNVRGQCGTGRDYVATSLGTLMMDADRPITFQRFQAKEIFGVGQHGFAVVTVKDEPGWAFILDPTFGQFMRPAGRTFQMEEATANVLREHPTGSFMARDLLRDGYIPLTQENATLYARAMGVPEDQAATMGARLLHGDAAALSEQVGGPDRRPPVTHITSNDIDTIAAEEMQGMLGRHVDELSGRGGGHATERAQLADLQQRLAEAMARGPVRAEEEGGPPVPARGSRGPAPRAPVPAFETEEAVPAPLSLEPPPMATPAAMRPGVVEPVGRSFRGDAKAEASLSRSTILNVVEALATSPGSLHGKLEQVGETWPPVYILRTRNGEVRVTIELTDAMPARGDKVPVARADPDLDPESGGYRLRVSSRAEGPRSIKRALAGLLTEIVAGHGAAELPDALRPGGSGGRLSAVDEGRLAQLATLARALDAAHMPEIRNAIQIEAEELVHALGLTGSSAAAANRRTAASRLEGMPDSARTLLTRAAEGAETNPFLLTLTGDRSRDMAVVEGALSRMSTLGSEEDANAWHKQLATVLAQSLIDQRIVVKPRSGEPFPNLRAMAELLGIDFIAASPALRSPETPEQELLAKAFAIAKEGLSSGKMSPSDWRKPAPGFEAEIISSKTGKLISASPSGEFPKGALTAEAAIKPSGELVAGLVKVRNDALHEYDTLEAELKLPTTDEHRREQIRDQQAKLDGFSNKAAEALGIEAGRAYARVHLDGFTESPSPRSGAGVTDLVYTHPDGRIVVIECKGGNKATLGTRLDISGSFYVQQGTIEYLHSLAATMAGGEAGPIRDLGERLKVELAREQPPLEYHVVRQPLNQDGSLASPEYGKFDLRANERRP